MARAKGSDVLEGSDAREGGESSSTPPPERDDDQGGEEEDRSAAGGGAKTTAAARAQEVGEEVAAAFASSSAQTDEFLVFPYEHLFPSAMPQWFAAQPEQGGGAGTTRSRQGQEEEEEGEGEGVNPYHLLDKYVEATIDKSSSSSSSSSSSGMMTDDAKVLRGQVRLLHNLVLFERHRRETLGLRNRRLLGKTKTSRILEEQNMALVSVERAG